MNVYFGASVTLSRDLLPVYQKIVSEIKRQGHRVLSEHVVDPKLKTTGKLDARRIFADEVAKIEKADVMVAEVTEPSWGTAFLVEEALEQGKPVLALYFKDAETPLPVMIQGHPELYVSHYTADNIKTVLAKHFEHFSQANGRRGKLVVIDGADGSGKSTQTKLLLSYYKKHGIAHTYISFPRYYTSFHGKHVGRFLAGEFGGNTDVSPYLSSLAFALDRLTARDEIVEWLREGKIVVADRYVSASLAHQGSKLPPRKRKAFLDWLYRMEYKEHKLPKEDVVIYLYVPVEVAQKLLRKEARRRDVADVDVEHQRRTVALYRQLVKRYRYWEMIRCLNSKGELYPKETIHEKILNALRRREII
ncbi:nucleoside 2-deoxyribosyltransferase [Patescibacteria group bacterium]|nr:nucleoside 2-deoxyribosyltransferase [Patescibacteria group bacterium]